MGRRARQRQRSGEPVQGPAQRPARAALREAKETMDASRPAGRVRFERRPDRERPRAPWHPLPVTEIVLMAGVAGVIVGMSRGPDRGKAALLLGLGLCVLSVAELTMREHMSGYRSHTLLLAFIPVVVTETVVAIVSGDRTAARIALVPEAIMFGLLFRFLRVRFHTARARRLATLKGGP